MISKDTNLFRLTPKIKMADIISHCPNMLNVLPRLGIPLGFGDKNIEQLCNENDVSLMLFMTIAKIYIYEDYSPDTEELEKCDMVNIINYILNSHKDYTDYKLPHIEHHLNNLFKNHKKYGQLIENYFSEFKKEITNHFKYEEEVVFPYLNTIVDKKNKVAEKYGKNEFNKQHDEIEDTLNDLINLLLKYIPAEVMPLERIDMLIDMYVLIADFDKHAMLEDRILIPYIKMLEKQKND